MIVVPREASTRGEYATFDDPEKRARDLRNNNLEGDIQEKRRFARHAYRLAWAWLIFLVVVTFLQATPDWFHFKLDDWAFRILFTSVTAAVLVSLIWWESIYSPLVVWAKIRDLTLHVPLGPLVGV